MENSRRDVGEYLRFKSQSFDSAWPLWLGIEPSMVPVGSSERSKDALMGAFPCLPPTPFPIMRIFFWNSIADGKSRNQRDYQDVLATSNELPLLI
jgi:hypothetical protein